MSSPGILHLHPQPAELACGRSYAERDEREPPLHDRVALAVWDGLMRLLLRAPRLQQLRARALVARVNQLSVELAHADDAQAQSQLRPLHRRLRGEGLALEPVALCLALVREASQRVLGKRHYDCQLMAGWSLLHGHLVEIATGEGKTLVASLPVPVAVAAAAAAAAAMQEAHCVRALGLASSLRNGEHAIVEPGLHRVRLSDAGRDTCDALDAVDTESPFKSGREPNEALHVILTEFNESPRIDRQLFGRSARQGDPGSAEAIVALDDELFRLHAPSFTRLIARSGVRPGPWLLTALRRVAQSGAERRNCDAREGSLRQDRRYAQIVAFVGGGA